jgi:hypothetical protein
MSHYAYVRDGKVVEVISAEQEFIDWITKTGHPMYPRDIGQWVQTSYNTRAGQHLQGGTPIRKNFAGVGYHYDSEADAFYPPRPFDTWILNTETYLWQAPVPIPDEDNLYEWDPTINNWKIWLEGPPK